jgi:hypothetical protein
MEQTMQTVYGGFVVAARRDGHRAKAPRRDSPQTLTPAQQTFADLVVLANNCAAAVTAVNNANLGRFSNDGSCDYDCGFMEQDWNWWFDFTNQKAATLLPAVNACNIQGPFMTAYSPTQQWLVDLSQYGASLTQSLTQISQIDAAIKASGNETPQQAQQLTAAFGNAATQAGNSLNEMNGALQQLAGYISGVQPGLGGLAAQSVNIQKADDAQIAGWRDNLIGQIACGSGTVTDQFAAAQAVLDGSFISFQPPFIAIDSQAGTALHDASVLPGAMLILQTDSSSFTDELNKAQNYPPASPLRTLHLNNATQDWTTLTTYAQAQLGT